MDVMDDKSNLLAKILQSIKQKRTEKHIPSDELERQLILGPGWIDDIENGNADISLGTLLAILAALDIDLSDIASDVKDIKNTQTINRYIYAVSDADINGINIHFNYSQHDAIYSLENATISDFDDVVVELRNGLAKLTANTDKDAEALKSDAVAKSFIKAMQLWPEANPSDIWYFVIYRAYCDRYNHPSKYSRLNYEQSWKRTGGWALEEVLVRHYKEALSKSGINIFIASTEVREKLLAQVKIDERLEADKADILLTGKINGNTILFGVVHVKASFAERRTDDVPMSQALVKAGYCSPLWTMDCKATPSATPVNKGELGKAKTNSDDKRSAKRKDIEDDGFFSACFSYNTNTISTPEEQDSSASIFNCDFRNPNNDIFTQFIIKEWIRFQKDNKD